MEDIIMDNQDEPKQIIVDRKRSRSSLDEAYEADERQTVIENNNTTITNKNSNNNNNMKMETEEEQEQEQTPPPSNRQRILDSQTIRGMKLEAIFHPKFENENLNNQQIRKSMIEKVSNGEGVLEVSLKHSGSLILWSGGRRFYSKNATDNVHTNVGEILLRQHFARAWRNHNSNEDDSGDTTNLEKEQKFLECSHYVETNRLTLSFEVVTSVLGHHGDLPSRDFLILIAVANRNDGVGTFFTTTQLMEFAQRFRLPHNDVWIFQSLESAKKLFHLYDTRREDGLADTVTKTLSDACDGGHIRSLYPHGIFQGQILEGVVIRFVRTSIHNSGGGSGDESVDGQTSLLQKLCEQSDSILKEVPPDLSLDWSTCMDSGDGSGALKLLQTNLRDIFDADDDDVSFAKTVDSIVKQSSHENYASRNVSKLGKKEVDVPSIACRLLDDKNIDFETHQICTLIRKLEELKLSVSYHVILEQTEASSGKNHPDDKQTRYLCIIHILHDSCHQKVSKLFHVKVLNGSPSMLS